MKNPAHWSSNKRLSNAKRAKNNHRFKDSEQYLVCRIVIDFTVRIYYTKNSF